MSGLGVLEKAGMLGPACQDSCLCPVSSTREERLGTPACPRAEAAGLEEWLRLQPSVGQRRGKEGTQGPPAPCLPPQRHGFLLTSWRSLGTAPSEQAMAGPRHKQPRAQSTNCPLQPIQWRPRHTALSAPSLSVPLFHQSRSLSHHRCSQGLLLGCG